MNPPILPLLLILTPASHLFPAPKCGATGNFTANSTYQITLTTLLSSISTINPLSLTYGFFKDSAIVSGASETLYVIGYCRGDLTAESCRACLNASAIDIRRLCPLQKKAVLYSEECTVRYSNASIFGIVMTDPANEFYNSYNISGQITHVLEEEVGGLRAEAAGGGSLRKYATRNIPVGQETIFAMAQCTPDLTKQQCEDCLRTIIQTAMMRYSGKAGFITMAPSCQFRYEIYPFFDPVAEPLPPPPLPPPAGSFVLA